MEVFPGGRHVPLTESSRANYCKGLEKILLSQLQKVTDAVRAGIYTILPPAILRLMEGGELERMACGSPRVDIDLLESMTTYDSCTRADAHIEFFWQVYREMSEEERTQVNIEI